MRLHFLGPSGLAVSEVALGTYEFGRKVSEDTARSLLDDYASHGGNVVDTADRYQDGRSEEIVGRLIKSSRDEWVVTTKIYFGQAGDGANRVGLSRRAIRQSIEGCLRRLGTDYIDVLTLHRFDPTASPYETLATLGELVASGTILYLGCSNVTGQELRALADAADRLCPPRAFCAVQGMYNPIDRGMELEVIPAAYATGLTVQAYSPLAQGLLTGKYFRDAACTGRLSGKLDRIDDGRMDAARRFVGLVHDAGAEPIPVAVRWLLDRGVQPVIGPTDRSQLRNYLGGIPLRLDADLGEPLERLAPPPRPYPYSSPGSPRDLASASARGQVDARLVRHPSALVHRPRG